VTLDLRGGRIGDPVARVLTADRLQDHNAPQDLAAVAPRPFDGLTVTERGLSLTLPPHSFLTVQAPLV
ncbi:MAG: alpha-N-arabinofuranosidase, partial [Streptomyces sp.]|nr:alpha-N-arabinofuranosidase [Streptomyces sp.]NUS29106.1 alpha-N-arabinofuranosidase [Streptomyces sp.]